MVQSFDSSEQLNKVISGNLAKNKRVLIRFKAANYNARAGDTIIGNLKRGNDGKFTSAGGGAATTAPKTKDPKAAAADTKRQQAEQRRQQRQQERDQDRQAAADAKLQQKRDNAAAIQNDQLGDDSEAFGFLTDPESDTKPEDLKPEYRDNLIKRGLLQQNDDGSYDLTPSANAYQKASERGDTKGAARILRRAQQIATRKAAAAAKRAAAAAKPKKKKKEATVYRIRFKAGPTAAQREDMSASDFVFSDERKFPVESRSAVMRAVHSWGRYQGSHSFEDFKRNLTRIAKRNGWESALPAEWQKENQKQKAKRSSGQRQTMQRVMHNFKHGGLHSGSKKGPLVTDRKQAIAIGLSESSKEVHTSAMLAFYVPNEVANQLTQIVPDSVPPEEMHLTLCYLGQIAELPYSLQDLQMAVESFASTAYPIEGEISGFGRFTSTDEGSGTNAFYASFDAPGLPQFRQDLVNCLARCGIEYAANHGYTPHITLSYLDKAAATPDVKLPAIPLKFNRLVLAWGGEQIEFQLGQGGSDPFAYYNSKSVRTLENAKDEEFDRLFLAGMIAHHQAALDMANLIPTHTKRPELLQLGQDIIKAQSDEISQMQQWQKSWGFVATKAVAVSNAGGLFNLAGLSPDVMNALPLPTTGDMVSWSSSRGKARGKIVSIHKASTVRKTPVKTVGTQDEPAARIEIYQQDEKTGEWQPTGTHIAHRLGDLTKLSANKSSGLTVFKQANGQYRWVTYSSSGYLDRDGEFVPTNELEADCDRADATKEYGPLYWWHLPELKLGECDFNMMHGRVLIESGTFDDPEVALAFKEYEEGLGVSIGFGYEARPARIYQGIRRKERSLLPAEVASNLLTRLFIQGDTEDMATKEEKVGLFEKLVGRKKVEGILAGAEQAEKSAQEMGLVFKAAGDATDPTAGDPTTAATDDPSMMDDPEDLTDGGADEDTEDDSDGDNVIDMAIEDLHAALDQAIAAQLPKALAPLQTAIDRLSSATKEAADTGSNFETLALAYKETTDLLATALKENTEALKSAVSANQAAVARIAQLETQVATLTGELPRAVKQRASTSPATVVPESEAQKLAAQKQVDPDQAAIGNLVGRMISGGLM